MLAVVLGLGFGFTITHHSIGIDNNAHDLYYHQGGVIYQGRLTALVLDKIFGIYLYPPFWANAVGAGVLYFSALAWCVLFARVGKDMMTPATCLIFASVLISYPIINEHFIFNPLNLPLGYGLTAFSLMMAYDTHQNRNISAAMASIVAMIFVISLNESFAAVFLIGMFCIFVLESLQSGSESTGFKLIRNMLVYIGILAAAIVLEWLITALVRTLVPSTAVVGASNARILWLFQPFLHVIKNLFWGVIGKYVVAGKTYFPITLFLAASLIFLGTMIWLTCKKKKPIYLVLIIFIFLSVVSVNIIKGAALPYRTDSALGIFIAFTMMFMWILLKDKWARVVFAVMMVVLVINQTRILNNWFVNDYERYEYDVEIVEHVSYDIEKNCDVSKPVLFIGWVNNSAATRNVPGEYNGIQFINAYSNYREEPNKYSFLLNDFFRIHGHDFADATDEYYEEGREIAEDMPSYPKPGYIREEEEYIIVNFN